MKKFLQKFLVFSVTSLFSITLFAQGIYVKVNASYGFGMSSQYLVNFGFYNFIQEEDSYTRELVNVSLGKGLILGATLGNMFNENIGVELGFSYLFGGKTKTKGTWPIGTEDYALSSRMLRLTPTLVLASGFGNMNPYAKFGVVIGSTSIMHETYHKREGNTWVEKMKLQGRLALGVFAGLGAVFNLNDNISFFGEMNMVNLSFAPTKGEITEATFNGIDVLYGMPIHHRKIEFVNSHTRNWTAPPVMTQPRQELKQKFPFGSIGLNIGLRINL
jgi:hypothetical protein